MLYSHHIRGEFCNWKLGRNWRWSKSGSREVIKVVQSTANTSIDNDEARLLVYESRGGVVALS